MNPTPPRTPATTPQSTEPPDTGNASTEPSGGGATDPDPAMQGEGNITAARRHRKSVEQFIEDGKVEPAAEQAAPHDAEEARDLQDAEDAGRSHARK